VACEASDYGEDRLLKSFVAVASCVVGFGLSLAVNAKVHELRGNTFDRNAGAAAAMPANPRSDYLTKSFALQSVTLTTTASTANASAARLYQDGGAAGNNGARTARDADEQLQSASGAAQGLMSWLSNWIPDPGTWAAVSMAGIAFILLMMKRVNRPE